MNFYLKNVLLGLVAVAVLTLPLHAQGKAKTEMVMPKSMDELINWHLDHGDFGTWSESGVTEAMWVGIPAGLPYSTVTTKMLSPDGTRILSNYRMATDDGRVISVGSSFTCWDAAKNAPTSSNSGFDMGKPYSGTSTMVGMGAGVMVWEYSETSQGKVNTYRQTDTMVDYNEWKGSVVKVDETGETGEPWTSTRTRWLPLKNHKGIAGMIGTWEMTMPDGTISREERTWDTNGTIVVSRGTTHTAEGMKGDGWMAVHYWDKSINRIATLFFGQSGAVLRGQVESTTTKGDATTMVTKFDGVIIGGMTLTVTMHQVIKPDSVTTSFPDTMLNGKDHPFSWGEITAVRERVDTPTKSKAKTKSKLKTKK
jgi:hypothetical protein